MKDDPLPIIVILGIVAIALFGGVKNPNTTGLISPTNNASSSQREVSVEQKKENIQNQINELRNQIQTEEDRLTQSQYKDKIKISYINRSTDSNQEYVTIKVNDNATGTIPVTGWVLKSLSTGNQVSIPKGTYLLFMGMMNVEDNVILTGGDTLYLVTGTSPNGANFKSNKCSGYLSQFQSFVPYLNTNCPLPRDEDLSSIPKLIINDACFDYIESFGGCRIQTEPLPIKWSIECTNFIYNKINYPSCINTHKNEEDFYLKEWRLYLRRSEKVWKDRRETIVLYDNLGKIVDTLKY
jgi:hypothetical protein